MDFAGQCAEIVQQTKLLAAAIDGADRTARVAACPDWNLAQLLDHVRSGHRWAEKIVRTRADHWLPDPALHHPNDTPPSAAELIAGATTLAATLLDAGPDALVFTPVPAGPPRAAFYARRFMNETTIHRADATLAAGKDFTVSPNVTHDAMAEWLTLGSLTHSLAPGHRALLGPGRTIHLSPTDHDTSWTVDLTGEALSWHPGPPSAAPSTPTSDSTPSAKPSAPPTTATTLSATTTGDPTPSAKPSPPHTTPTPPSTATLSGSLTDLLLIVYRRLPVDTVRLTGDTAFLDRWLSTVGFG